MKVTILIFPIFLISKAFALPHSDHAQAIPRQGTQNQVVFEKIGTLHTGVKFGFFKVIFETANLKKFWAEIEQEYADFVAEGTILNPELASLKSSMDENMFYKRQFMGKVDKFLELQKMDKDSYEYLEECIHYAEVSNKTLIQEGDIIHEIKYDFYHDPNGYKTLVEEMNRFAESRNFTDFHSGRDEYGDEFMDALTKLNWKSSKANWDFFDITWTLGGWFSEPIQTWVHYFFKVMH